MHKQHTPIGDSDLAFELVSEAYLDNYEFLEAPLAEVNPSLMKTIEDNMREELRNMIQSGASYNEIKTQILFLSADLETAHDAVTLYQQQQQPQHQHQLSLLKNLKKQVAVV